MPEVAPDLVRQARMQGKAAPGQAFERAAIAPVERQEASRLARRRAGNPGPFDDGCLYAAATQEIGDRGTDYASATDQDPH